jgi:TonB family protein
MVTPGPSRLSSVPTVKGGPGVLRRWRQPMGWAAMLTSFSIHGAAMAVMVWLSIGGQGHEGIAGDDSNEAEVAAPVMQLLPKPAPQSQTFRIRPRPVKALRTSNLKTLLVKSPTAALQLPEWQMPKSAVLGVLAAPSQAMPKTLADEQPPSKSSNSSNNQHKAVGQGAGKGRGAAKIAGELPHLIASTPPVYPYAARRANISGTATVRVAVSAAGRVLDCKLQSSTGNADLDAAALRSVKSWRFTPAVRDGVEVLVRVNFKLA